MHFVVRRLPKCDQNVNVASVMLDCVLEKMKIASNALDELLLANGENVSCKMLINCIMLLNVDHHIKAT